MPQVTAWGGGGLHITRVIRFMRVIFVEECVVELCVVFADLGGGEVHSGWIELLFSLESIYLSACVCVCACVCVYVRVYTCVCA